MLGGLGSVSGSLIAAYVVGYLETMTASPDVARLSHDPFAAAAGRGHVPAPTAGPVRAEVNMSQMFASRLFWIGIAAFIAAMVLPMYVSGYVLGLLTVAYYTAVFAMSWDLLFGFAGEVNFGPTFP